MSGLSIQGTYEQSAKKWKEGEKVMEQIQSLTEGGVKPFFALGDYISHSTFQLFHHDQL